MRLPAVTELERKGKLQPGTHRGFVASAIGAAAAPSGPRFDVSTPQGRGELGFTQVGGLLSVRGISCLGPQGPEVQRVTAFTFGVRPGGLQSSASKALVDFFTSPELACRIKHAGLGPR